MGPAGTKQAWLELAVAARTNEALRAPMRETMQDFDRQILAAFRTLQPLGPVPAALEEPALMLTFAVLNGLAVASRTKQTVRPTR